MAALIFQLPLKFGAAVRPVLQQNYHSQVVDRLGRIDPEFRAPIVLRDVLGFEDEESVRILGLRWGVYRHRLHRGRLECKDALRGRSMPTAAPPC